MVLLDNLYTIISNSRTDSGEDFLIHLNADHYIYNAHFPGEPITPGVCILQMCIELLSRHTGQQLKLSCALNVKYLKIIVPSQCPDLLVSLRKLQQISTESGKTITKAQFVVSAGDEIHTKLSLECEPKE